MSRRSSALLGFCFCLAVVLLIRHARKTRQDWISLESGVIVGETCSIEPEKDCGFVGIGQEECLQRGCCWKNSQGNSNKPWCYHPSSNCTWKVETKSVIDQDTLELKVVPVGSCNRFGYTNPVQLTLRIQQTCQHVRIRSLTPELPEVLPQNSPSCKDSHEYPLQFSYSEYPFSFTISRNKIPIYTSSKLYLFEDFMEISSQVPLNANIYGVGEVARDAFRRNPNDTRQAFWNRDAASPSDENLYGSHPFYVEIRSGLAHGVFMRNQNGGDFILEPGFASFRFLSLPLDLFIFAGPNPNQVVLQYWQVIGFPGMIPIWSLGYQHSRYGFTNLEEMEQVVKDYTSNGLPLDAIWADIDYMKDFKDFTYSPKFPLDKFQAFAKSLESSRQHLVLILDPAITVEPGYAPYDDGLVSNVFLKDSNGKVLVGEVWPGPTAFPDFSHVNITKWWGPLINNLLKELPGISLWLDMNEPSSFCDTSCGQNSSSPLDKPLYKINNMGNNVPLWVKTVAPSTLHYNNVPHASLHNVYGFQQVQITRTILEQGSDKRLFVLSRSTAPGSGRYAIHWLGDNFSSQESYLRSITGILNFQLFGIPMTGADVCGFIGNATEELCGRWMILASYQPFFRNHNAIGTTDQMPYLWPNVLKVTKKHLAVRHRMIPMWYTALWRASRGLSASVVSSLPFLWPNHDTMLLDRQYVIDEKVLISPPPWIDGRPFDAYFPDEVWYDWWSLTRWNVKGWHHFEKVGLDFMNVHVRGGSVVPLFHLGTLTTLTELHLKAEYDVLVALDSQGNAKGDLLIDDGETRDAPYVHLEFDVTTSHFETKITKDSNLRSSSAKLRRIFIVGLASARVQGYKHGNLGNVWDKDENCEDEWSFSENILVICVSRSLTKPLKIQY